MNGFKTFSANAIGGGVGAGIYTFATSVLIHGAVNLISLAMGMARFSALLAPSAPCTAASASTPLSRIWAAARLLLPCWAL